MGESGVMVSSMGGQSALNLPPDYSQHTLTATPQSTVNTTMRTVKVRNTRHFTSAAEIRGETFH